MTQNSVTKPFKYLVLLGATESVTLNPVDFYLRVFHLSMCPVQFIQKVAFLIGCQVKCLLLLVLCHQQLIVTLLLNQGNLIHKYRFLSLESETRNVTQSASIEQTFTKYLPLS